MDRAQIDEMLARAVKGPKPWKGKGPCHCTPCDNCGNLFRTADDIDAHRAVCLSRHAEELIPALVALLPPAIGESKPARRWEYLNLERQWKRNDEDSGRYLAPLDMTKLNKLGSEGWEAVACGTNSEGLSFIMLKREIGGAS